jgi:hypothetical protein
MIVLALPTNVGVWTHSRPRRLLRYSGKPSLQFRGDAPGRLHEWPPLPEGDTAWRRLRRCSFDKRQASSLAREFVGTLAIEIAISPATWPNSGSTARPSSRLVIKSVKALDSGQFKFATNDVGAGGVDQMRAIDARLFE